MKISLIVAVADNGVIGREGKLPWRLGSDLRRFRALTMGHPLVMGRKTFDSIGKPLDGRDSIVVTRGGLDTATFGKDSLFVAPSLEHALRVAGRCAATHGVDEIFIIGGAGLFSQALPLAQKVYLTRVHGNPGGDTYWEPVFGDDWREVSRESRSAGDRDEFPVTDLVLERIQHA